MRRRLILMATLACAAASAIGFSTWRSSSGWSSRELKDIQSLSLASLPALKLDPSNRVSDDPAAAALGRKLFFDTRLSANGKIACATCHKPERQFQDDRPVGLGIAEGSRRTMPIAGSAYFPFLFWDGRKDSQWAQALGPLENPIEHGADRTMVVRLVATAYKKDYEAIFGMMPDVSSLPSHAMPGGTNGLDAAWTRLSPQEQDAVNRAYANVGKAIAAFERTIAPQPTRLDSYASALATGNVEQADRLLTKNEREGLKLFIGRASCATCHNGPLLTDNAFHNIGLPNTDMRHNSGRLTSVSEVKADPFNCIGPYSDSKPSDCLEIKFLQAANPALAGAFRSPSLRGIADRAPYMHAGQFDTLRAVLDHYNAAPHAAYGKSELRPLKLSAQELGDLEDFLRTLNPLTD